MLLLLLTFVVVTVIARDFCCFRTKSFLTHTQQHNKDRISLEDGEGDAIFYIVVAYEYCKQR